MRLGGGLGRVAGLGPVLGGVGATGVVGRACAVEAVGPCPEGGTGAGSGEEGKGVVADNAVVVAPADVALEGTAVVVGDALAAAERGASDGEGARK